MIASSKPASSSGIVGTARGFVAIIDTISRWSGHLIAPVALGYMLIIVFEVVARYVFNSPTRWAHELSTFLFGAQFMLGGAYCLWRGSMVNVEILHQRFPFRVQATVDAVFLLIPITICALMIWLGGQQFLVSFAKLEHTNTTWGPPLYPLKGVIPLAAFLLLLQALAQFVRRVYAAITGQALVTSTEAKAPDRVEAGKVAQ
jgi:TRAP-type mannitol/chloroaromatic compound transport system permease small subunit